MGRKRKKDLDLPARWRRQNGAIYYLVPPGQESQWGDKKWFRLGANVVEAHRAWADRMDNGEKAITLNQLFDRYLIEHTPTCAIKTQRHHIRAIKNLRVVFGEIDINREISGNTEPTGLTEVWDYFGLTADTTNFNADLTLYTNSRVANLSVTTDMVYTLFGYL